MLKIRLKDGERITVGHNVTIHVEIAPRGRKTWLHFEAPREVGIYRRPAEPKDPAAGKLQEDAGQ